MEKFARLTSYLFHPVFVYTYMAVILVWVVPYEFGSSNLWSEAPLLLLVFFSTALIPGLAVLMMKGLGLIESIEMRSGKERIIPLIAVMVCYFSTTLFLMQNPDIPELMKIIALGASIAVALCFIISIFYKISLHAIGMGAVWILVLFLVKNYYFTSQDLDLSPFGVIQISMPLLLIIITLLSSIVLSSRLILKAHEKTEVYAGFILGMCAMFLAYILI